jgi:hypothetical protein
MIEAERTVARARLDPRGDSLLGLVRACPNPGVVISQSRTIIAYNDPFSEWLGPEHERLAGLNLTSALQVRTSRSLVEVWSDLVSGLEPAIHAHVLHVAPGRVSAAPATIVPLRSQGGEEFHAVMWLLAKAKPAPSAAGDPPADTDRLPA